MPSPDHQCRTKGQTVLVNDSKGPTLVQFRGAFLKAMVAEGHCVHVTAPDLDDPIAAELRSLGVTPHSVPLARTGLNPVADLRYLRAIRRLIRDTAADLVLGYTIKPNVWGSLAARSLGVPSISVVTGLGYAFIAGTTLKQRLAGALARALYRHATARNRVVIFQNPDDRDLFIRDGILTEEGKGRLINGSGVDMRHYRPVPLPPEPIFLMVSRLLGNKGVREYASAALGVLRTRSDVRFQLVGFIDIGPDGIGQSELDKWIAQGLEFLGPLDDVRLAIAKASIVVLPSYREGTPRSVLEAMAMGRPIITSDVAGCRETVMHGENGLLVPARDVAALEDALRFLADRPDVRLAMGRKSVDYCRSKFDVNEVNARLLQITRLSTAQAVSN
jgi:glycosyltransferase involved in cell wall biosynthesis